MERKEEKKLLNNLSQRLFSNMLKHFFTNYKKSLPWILLIVFQVMIVVFHVFLFSSEDIDFESRVLNDVDEDLLRIAGYLATLFIFMFSFIPSVGLIVYDNPTLDFLFPSPVRRRTIFTNRLSRSYLINFVFSTIFMLSAILIMSSFLEVKITFLQWSFIVFSVIILFAIFTNLHIIWTIESLKWSLRKKEIMEYSIIFFILAITINFILKFWYALSNNLSLIDSAMDTLNLFPYNIILILPNMAIDIIVADSLSSLIIIKFIILLLIASTSTFYIVKIDIYIYEDYTLEHNKRLKVWAGKYGTDIPALQNITPVEPWWRKGFLKKIRLDFPTKGNKEWVIFNKNIILSLRNGPIVLIQIILLYFFMIILIESKDVGWAILYSLILILLSIVFLMNLNYNLLGERKQLEIIKMLPIKGSKIIFISVLSTIIIPLILYFSYITYFIISTSNYYYWVLYPYYICGPVYIIICALGVHFSYFYAIKYIDFITFGGTSIAYTLGILVVITLFLLNIDLFIILYYVLKLNDILVLTILTIINIILIVLLFKWSSDFFENSDIKG